MIDLKMGKAGHKIVDPTHGDIKVEISTQVNLMISAQQAWQVMAGNLPEVSKVSHREHATAAVITRLHTKYPIILRQL